MHLSEYMAAHELTDETVAQSIGRSRVSVSRYRRKLERPSLETARRLHTWSEGAIALEDWPAPQHEAAE